MKKNILQLINCHEEEDKQKVNESLKQSIIEEFENADVYINAINSNRYDLIPDYTVSTSKDLPVKKAEKFYIRKHTGCIAKYFHSHNFYELIYVHSGKCEQYLNDNGSPEVIEERQLCLLTPGAVHALEPAKPEDLVFKIYIPTIIFETIINDIEKEMPALSEMTAKNKIHYFIAESGFTDLLLMKLIEDSVFEYEGKDSAIKSCLTLMILSFL